MSLVSEGETKDGNDIIVQIILLSILAKAMLLCIRALLINCYVNWVRKLVLKDKKNVLLKPG